MIRYEFICIISAISANMFARAELDLAEMANIDDKNDISNSEKCCLNS